MKGTHVIKATLAVCFSFSAFIAGSAFAQVGIERLAPANSVVIVGTKNTKAMMDHVQATSLWSLWNDEQVKAMRADAMKEMAEGLTEMFQDLGVQDDSLVPPTGAAGFALFPVMDEELGIHQPGMIAFADYGDQEKSDKTHALLMALLERGKKDGKLDFDEEDVNGRTVYSIDLSKLNEAEEAEDEDDFGGMGMMPMPKPEDVMKGLEKLHYAREGNVLMMASGVKELTDALASIDAPAGNDNLAERPDYKAITGKLGENDAFVIVLTRDIMQLIAGADPMGMMQMMQPMVRAAFGKVDGYGVGLQFEGPNAMVEQKIAVYMPTGKKGFTTLLTGSAPRANVPPFVSPDAVSYSTVAFNFQGLMPVIREVVASNPMAQGQMGPALDQMEPIVNQLTSALGSRMHMTASVTKPLTATSYASVTAIECTKPQEFENAFAALAAQGGFEARDFLGQRIFSMDPEMMGGEQAMSVGIGGGFVFIGATPSVEQTLRATSQPAQGTIASDAQYQRAIAALPLQDVIAWGFSDTIDAAEAMFAVQRETARKMIEEIREDDPEFAQEMEDDLKKEWETFDKFDFNLLRKYIGPSVWQIRATDDGFEGSFLMLSSEGAK